MELVHNYDPLKFVLLPMLELTMDDFPQYLGSYLGDYLRPDLNGNLIVCLRIGSRYRIAHKEEIAALQKHSNYVEDYDYDNERKTMFVFSISKEWQDDFDKIFTYKKGIWEYDEDAVVGVSDDYKKAIFTMHSDDTEFLEELLDKEATEVTVLDTERK